MRGRVACAHRRICISLWRACAARQPRHRPPQRQDRHAATRAATREALAVRDGRIVGGRRRRRSARWPAEHPRIDLAGRTVIPGLIDSHIHAIRAGLTFATEVHWIGARIAGRSARPHPCRGAEGAEGTPGWWSPAAGPSGNSPKAAARPRPSSPRPRPITTSMCRLFYSAVLLSPGGAEALGIARRCRPCGAAHVERDDDGTPTGWISGDNRADQRRLRPAAAAELRAAGGRHARLLPRAQRVGVTGVIDPGGYNLPLVGIPAAVRLWRDRALTLRVAYSLCAPRRGHELEDFKR